MKEQPPSLLKFPSEFTLKVMGKADTSFEDAAVEIMRRYFPQFSRDNYKKRLSRDNHYLALTMRIYVLSKSQLDAIYQSLSQEKSILFVL